MKTKEELKSEYISKNTKNWDEETKEKYMYELEEDFKIWYEGYTQCQEDMQKDVEYWQVEFEHWYRQAMYMSNKYNELLNKQDNE